MDDTFGNVLLGIVFSSMGVMAVLVALIPFEIMDLRYIAYGLGGLLILTVVAILLAFVIRAIYNAVWDYKFDKKFKSKSSNEPVEFHCNQIGTHLNETEDK